MSSINETTAATLTKFTLGFKLSKNLKSELRLYAVLPFNAPFKLYWKKVGSHVLLGLDFYFVFVF